MLFKGTNLPFPSPGDVPNPGTDAGSPASQADTLPSKSPGKTFFFLQSCLTLFDPMDCSPPDSSVHGILQARIVEWVAFPTPEDLLDPGIKERKRRGLKMYFKKL